MSQLIKTGRTDIIITDLIEKQHPVWLRLRIVNVSLQEGRHCHTLFYSRKLYLIQTWLSFLYVSVSPSTPFVRRSGFICRFPLASPRASPFLLFLVATVLRFPVAERFQFSRLESTHVYDTQPNGDGATASVVAAILALRGIASPTS